MTRHHRWAGAASVAFAASALLASACGESASLVGGECIAGYTPCGGTCCRDKADGAATGSTPLDAGRDQQAAPGNDASDGSSDGGSRQQGTNGDASDAADSSPVGDAGPASDSASSEDTGVATGDDAGGDDASGEAGPGCTPPTVWCGAGCVDVTDDPYNCGGCGVVCPSQICVASTCVGSTAGGIVFIGDDYATAPMGVGPSEVLSNAVFMPRSNPLRVLSYDRYAKPEAPAYVASILDGMASQLGRHLVRTTTATDSYVASKLSVQSFDVLIVHDQARAASGAMQALGTSWASALGTFTQQHGIVVILDGGTGVGEMPQFSSGTGLLQVTAQSPATPGTVLDVTAPGDAVGIGVLSPFAATSSSVFVTTEPNGGDVAYVVTGADAGASPLVIHKVL
jgi:hypothetical protein